MTRATQALLVQAACGWSAWLWLGQRLATGPAKADNWVALGLGLFFLFRPRVRPDAGFPYLAAAGLMALYAAAHVALPPAAAAALALAALAWARSRAWAGQATVLPVVGLLWLCLPVVPTLDFYLGWPLRWMAAHLAAVWLRLGGLPVDVQGACLALGDRQVWIDAPCSGVRMLWAAAFLACALAALAGMGWRATAALGLCAAAAVVAGNALRSAALFLLETADFSSPAAALVHAAAGLVSYALLAALVVAAAVVIARQSRARP